MEFADVGGAGGEGADDLHLAVEIVVLDEVVGHADAVGLHGVALAVVVVADGGLVEVGDAALGGVGAGGGEGGAGEAVVGHLVLGFLCVFFFGEGLRKE